jgi:hypothetical protein
MSSLPQIRDMRGLISLTLFLWLSTATLVLTARVIGAEQPSSQLVAAMYVDDCTLPCWIGIVPGQATLGEAVARLTSVFDLPSDSQTINGRFRTTESGYTVTTYGESTTVIFMGNANNDTVEEFVYLLSDQSLRLGDIMLAYGLPTCFSRRDVNTWNIVYHINGQTTTFLQRGRRLRYTHPIQTVMFAPHNRVVASHSCFTVPGGFGEWRGIAPAWRYVQLAF